MSGFYRPQYSEGTAIDEETGEPTGKDELFVHHAPNAVYAPTHTIHVDRDKSDPTLPAGWVYSDMPPQWAQATGAHDVQFHDGDIVTMPDGTMWQSTVDNNVWKPGESGWRPYSDDGLAAWQAPTGAHGAYGEGERVAHGGKEWTSDLGGNVWEPGVYGWSESAPAPGPGSTP